MDATLQMLKELTEANGVPGQEGPVREVMARYLEGTGEIITDNLGSIVSRKSGSNAGENAPKVWAMRPLDYRNAKAPRRRQLSLPVVRQQVGMI